MDRDQQFMRVLKQAIEHVNTLEHVENNIREIIKSQLESWLMSRLGDLDSFYYEVDINSDFVVNINKVVLCAGIPKQAADSDLVAHSQGKLYLIFYEWASTWFPEFSTKLRNYLNTAMSLGFTRQSELEILGLFNWLNSKLRLTTLIIPPEFPSDIASFALAELREALFSIKSDRILARINELRYRLEIEMWTKTEARPTFFTTFKPTDVEKDLLEALGKNNLTAPELLAKAGYDNSSHYRSVLSGLVKRSILGRNENGYFAI